MYKHTQVQKLTACTIYALCMLLSGFAAIVSAYAQQTICLYFAVLCVCSAVALNVSAHYQAKSK